MKSQQEYREGCAIFERERLASAQCSFVGMFSASSRQLGLADLQAFRTGRVIIVAEIKAFDRWARDNDVGHTLTSAPPATHRHTPRFRPAGRKPLTPC